MTVYVDILAICLTHLTIKLIDLYGIYCKGWKLKNICELCLECHRSGHAGFLCQHF